MDGATGQDCEQMRAVWDRASRAHVLVAVHDTRLGPAHGGIRRWNYDDAAAAARDVVALARAMTWKCALAEVPAGGGKAVILDRPALDRAGAYRVVGRVVESLGGTFFTGPDVNTSAADLAVVAEETRYVATAADDGPGDLAAATADGRRERRRCSRDERHRRHARWCSGSNWHECSVANTHPGLYVRAVRCACRAC